MTFRLHGRKWMAIAAIIAASATMSTSMGAQATYGTSDYGSSDPYSSSTGNSPNGEAGQSGGNGVTKSSFLVEPTPEQLPIQISISVIRSSSISAYYNDDFTVSPATMYSITDPAAVLTGSSSGSEGTFQFTLQDLTTSVMLYSDMGSILSGPIVSGSSTGLLNGTDQYRVSYKLSLDAVSPSTLSYNPTVNFTTAATPEPSSLVLLCTGLAGTAAAFRRRVMA